MGLPHFSGMAIQASQDLMPDQFCAANSDKAMSVHMTDGRV